MELNKSQTANYFHYVKIGIILLILTALNITIAGMAQSELISGIIVAISAIQAAITLIWLMHLDVENMLLRIFVALVFVVYIIVIIITFFDYSFR